MNVILTQSYEESARKGAELILDAVSRKPDLLLGLATGETPVAIYRRLCEAYQAGAADFSRASSVNLDEYVGCREEDSYRRFMDENLFSKINIPRENITIADYAAPPEAEVTRLRQFFETHTVDLQLLGIGANGHIGFNEPDHDGLEAPVHISPLTQSTKEANAHWFADGAVPDRAITMGMGDILRAKSILLVVKGESKRAVLRELLNGGKVTTNNPATFLLLHPDVTLITEESLTV
ncbi:MAG: glucosamine-6-phosphate deaminase [Oscillospiraceae bacterium]|jgi:glucosamine-6-phosphate deaminase|nr:glucosamine-6-phosphate deaminase [Oscillospiraceae bacterium]